MRHLIIIIFLLIIPGLLFAEESAYVFVVDGNLYPLYGYKIVPTHKDNLYITKIAPIKKWIASVKSQLIVARDGYVYPVKDSIIVDKAKGIAVLLVDFYGRKSLYFNPEENLTDRDISVLIENKQSVIAKVNKIFSSELKKFEINQGRKIYSSSDYNALAEYYENSGQWDKAISVYEKLLKEDPKNQKIIKKIGILYYQISDFKKAREYLLMLPANEEVITKVAGIYIIEKNFEGALKVINNSGLNSPYLHYLKGIIYYLSDKKNDAYKEVSILLNMDNRLAQNLRDLLK